MKEAASWILSKGFGASRNDQSVHHTISEQGFREAVCGERRSFCWQIACLDILRSEHLLRIWRAEVQLARYRLTKVSYRGLVRANAARYSFVIAPM